MTAEPGALDVAEAKVAESGAVHESAENALAEAISAEAVAKSEADSADATLKAAEGKWLKQKVICRLIRCSGS